MRYDDEIDWGYGEEEAEEEALFIELRKVGRTSLKGFSDAIAAIDDALYTSYVHSVVIGTFDAFEKLGAEVDWREAELALHVLYLFGEASRGQMQFVVTQGSTTLAPLGEMLLKMVTSKISTYPHPSVPLQFFENAVRYYQFFEIRPEGIPDVLEAFVDTRGLHHSMRQIRSRSWYLFHRFVKFLRPKMGNYVEIVLGSIQDLLVIQAELPAPSPSGTDSNISANNSGSTFDSQLYLFEAVGMLISHEAIPAEKQVKYLEAVLNPLVKGIQENMSKEMYNPEDELFPLQLHHLIMAIGSVAKGFPEAPNGAASVQRPWAVVFKQATEITLMVLEALNRFEKIREATRFAFSRLVHCLGAEMLPYLPPLINSLLNEFQVTELLDFLPFVGLIGHKYKPVIFNILNDLLLPLVNKVFGFLNQTPSGTDEAVLLLDLRKAYLTFVIQLFNLDLESVFVSDCEYPQQPPIVTGQADAFHSAHLIGLRLWLSVLLASPIVNRPHLNMILQSVLHYANDTSETVTQKMAFGILLKTVNAWGGSAQQPSTSTEPSGVGQPLPGFEQFMFESIVRVSFEVPMKQSFNLSDGQTVLAFGEISGIQKAIYAKQGTRFIEYMRGVYLPSIQCPPNMAEDYLQALQQLEMRAFKKFFQAFIQNSKS
ncbi:armadillo-type protein [Jimgerdemannia flammicorona]|uniref:Exportin-T n=1 Tax=Jimgerdemannia flammicorona TaxID=994334 RepID=A0A433A145_9FUNG|nr:armadillo-type protein [Jimgerdemannia flammicorona]